MRIALKVDVDTYRGTLIGVPALLELFQKYNIQASFLFSLGPDHTGRAIRRIFKPGFLKKVQRTSVIEHYGYRTLLYGVLLPGPHIGKKAGHIMRQVREEGHEVGIHCYDHVLWQDHAYGQDEKWTRNELQKAQQIFKNVLGTAAKLHGAAGWQVNPHLFRWEEESQLDYASDVRGSVPFYPIMDGQLFHCLQIPTTLPTLDELIGRAGYHIGNVEQAILNACQKEGDHVYTLHAELEGMKLKPILEKMIQSWLKQGVQIGSLNALYRSLDLHRIPKKEVIMNELPGRSGRLAMAMES